MPFFLQLENIQVHLLEKIGLLRSDLLQSSLTQTHITSSGFVSYTLPINKNKQNPLNMLVRDSMAAVRYLIAAALGGLTHLI